MTVGNRAYAAVFSVFCFAVTVYFIIDELLPQAAREHWPITTLVAWALGFLAFGLLPSFLFAMTPYKITMTDDGECEFQSLLRRRRVRAQQIRSIEWDDDGKITIRHDRGKVKILADRGFVDPLKRLFQLNPSIEADAGVLEALGVVRDRRRLTSS